MLFLNPSWSLNILGIQYKFTYLQHIVRMPAIWFSPDCVLSDLKFPRDKYIYVYKRGKVRIPTFDMKWLAWI
jgi:hypothetical protein